MRTNVKERWEEKTHEGAKATRINAEQQLRRSVMACLLWEREFYEDGVMIADRIASLIPTVNPLSVASMAIEARTKMKLRHVPLLLCRELARNKNLDATTLSMCIQRADEITEFLSLYWQGGKCPLAAQVKKGLADAFTRFDEYQLAKYNRDGAVKLKDALFLCHAKPQNKEQEVLWKRLVDGELKTPDTWEVALSSGADKKTTWERLLSERKLGGLALLRNLRNMEQAAVCRPMVQAALREGNFGRILPFRFLAAAVHAPRYEADLDEAMLRTLSARPKWPGQTVLLVDVSGSMVGTGISAKSEIDRLDAASGLAILARELCEECRIYAFSCPSEGNGPAPAGAAVTDVKVRGYYGRLLDYKGYCVELPARRGMALRDKIRSLPHDGTPLGWAIKHCESEVPGYDRLIVLTDEQSHDPVSDPVGTGYMINVASAKNGIGYGTWTHIDGWSEAVIDYIRESEAT